MFGNCLIEMAAHAAGFTDAQLAVIEKELPACRKLIDLVVKAQPLIKEFVPILNQAEPLIKQALPMIQQATPLVQEASKEIQAIAPAIQIVIGVIQRNLAAGSTVEQSFNNVARRIQGAFGGGANTW